MIPFLSAEVKRICSARGETNPVVPLGLTAGIRRGFTLPAGDREDKNHLQSRRHPRHRGRAFPPDYFFPTAALNSSSVIFITSEFWMLTSFPVWASVKATVPLVNLSNFSV
jgi:hypothetical protein